MAIRLDVGVRLVVEWVEYERHIQMDNSDSKLKTLAKLEGCDEMDILEAATYDGVCPGICVNKGCEYTTQVEPDQRAGHCESCNTKTVKSEIGRAHV